MLTLTWSVSGVEYTMTLYPNSSNCPNRCAPLHVPDSVFDDSLSNQTLEENALTGWPADVCLFFIVLFWFLEGRFQRIPQLGR